MSVCCRICSSEAILLFKSLKDVQYEAKESVDIFKCTRCDHLFVYPDFSDFQISSFYSSYSTHEVAFRINKIVENWRSVNEFIFSFGKILKERKNAENLKLNSTKILKLLDIGCGSGGFLANVSAENNIIGYGVDFDPMAIKAAKKRGLNNVYQKSIKDLNEKFDVITLNHLIEHIQNISQFNIEIRNICNQDCLIFLRTPNAASFCSRLFGKYWRGIEAPRHLNIFSPKSIIMAFESLGDTQVQTSNAMLFPIWIESFSLFLEKRLFFKRKIGTLLAFASFPLAVLISNLVSFVRDSGEELVVKVRVKLSDLE